MKYLGKQSNRPIKKPETVPFKGARTLVTLHCNEFTSICPVTSQPDFANLVISYIPRSTIIETKSLKLYLWKFRNKKSFNEPLVNLIADELWDCLDCSWLSVEGRFNARGGIAVTAVAERGER